MSTRVTRLVGAVGITALALGASGAYAPAAFAADTPTTITTTLPPTIGNGGDLVQNGSVAYTIGSQAPFNGSIHFTISGPGELAPNDLVLDYDTDGGAAGTTFAPVQLTTDANGDLTGSFNTVKPTAASSTDTFALEFQPTASAPVGTLTVVTDFVNNGATTPAATDTDMVNASVPVVTVDTPDSLVVGGDKKTFDSDLTNNTGSDYSNGRLDFTIAPAAGGSALSANDLLLEFQMTDGTYTTIPLTPQDDGSLKGSYGPDTGFTVPDGASGGPTFRISATSTAPSEDITTSIAFVTVDSQGTPTTISTTNAGTTALVSVPSAPTNVTATRGDKSVTVNWSPPTDDGNGPLTYNVTLTSSNSTTTRTGLTGTSTTFSGLTNGTLYTATVKAVNEAGTSPASDSASATPAAPAAPGAPTDVSATPGDSSAVVTFTAPADDGQSTITKYTVTATPSTGTAIIQDTTGSPTTVTGLTNGTTYAITVTATNALGTSPASSPAASVTPAVAQTAPGAPTNVSATPGDASAVVSFTAPTNNGGSAITGYTITATPSTGTPITQDATGSPTTVTGLTNGTTYAITVTATNANGTSAPSNSASVTPAAPAAATAPGAPTGVTATPGDTTAQVTFDAPSSNGGSTITKYTVTATAGGDTVSKDTTVTSATLTGLTNGTTYSVTVTATNNVGTSAASSPAQMVTPTAAAPAPVRGDLIAVTGTNRALYVRDTSTDAGFRSLGGTSIDAPAFAISNDGTAYYVVVGTDHNLYVRTDDLGFKPLGPAGTNCSGVSVAISGETLAVACKGAGNHLYVGKATLTNVLPTVTRFSNLGGTLLYGTTTYATNNAGDFFYAVVGTTHAIYGRTDTGSFSRDPGGPSCYGPLGAESVNNDADFACADSAGALQVVSNDTGEYVTLPGKVVGRPGVSLDADGVTRYIVLGTTGKIYTASQAADGTITPFRAGPEGAGLYGVAAGSTSTVTNAS